jgi:hypothetical protein
MAHEAQRVFFGSVKQKFPDRFINCDVVDIGSLDINGNNRWLFEGDYKYIGVDVGAGKNVDFISKAHEYKPGKQYDVTISSECYEHDMFYKETLKNCVELTKSNGLFTFTCAGEGRGEHGTRRANPVDAPLLNDQEEWGNYYRNLTENDVREVLDVDSIFSEYYFEYNPTAFDLYFWGIKK